MDAKSRANFINSVASGSSVACSKCGTSNKSGAKFCISCGTEIATPKKTANNAPAFESAKETVAVTSAKYTEPESVFAQGLPAWSIEPPQIMVRRH